MTPADIHSTYKQVLSCLSKGKLKRAFEKAESLNNELQSAQYHESLQNMQTGYKYMLQYFIDGMDDPERKSIYNKLIARLFVLASQLRDELLTRDSNNFEFLQKRYFPFTPQISAGKLLKISCELKKCGAPGVGLKTRSKFNKMKLNLKIRYAFYSTISG